MQPFEAHIPYMLQFFQDYEISGMDWIEFSWKDTPDLISFRLDSSGKYSTMVELILFPTIIFVG